jgi:hypothetical protein
MYPALSDKFFLGRGASQYGGVRSRSGLLPGDRVDSDVPLLVRTPGVSSTGDFGFESMTLFQAYPETNTKWAV